MTLAKNNNAKGKLAHKKTRGQKTKSKKWMVAVMIALVIASLGILGGWLLRQNSISTSNSSKLLFVLKGDMNITNKKLTITDRLVEWFTDRPEHKAGTMSPQKFLDIWNQNALDDNSPNAAFSDSGAVVELSNPTITGNGSLEFSYKPISGTLASGAVADAAMFVDAFPTPINDIAEHCETVNCQITDKFSLPDQSICNLDVIGEWIQVTTVSRGPQAHNGTSCDQHRTLVSKFLNSIPVPVKSGSLSYTGTVNFPEPNTEWTCSGIATYDPRPGDLGLTSCKPTNTALQSKYGFDVIGQTLVIN